MTLCTAAQDFFIGERPADGFPVVLQKAFACNDRIQAGCGFLHAPEQFPQLPGFVLVDVLVDLPFDFVAVVQHLPRCGVDILHQVEAVRYKDTFRDVIGPGPDP